MGVIDFAQYVSQAIEAGNIVDGTAVKVIADNGSEIGDAVFKVIQGGNGASSEVAIATSAGTGGAVATGFAYLALDVGLVGAAIAPTLGVLAGAGLYSLAPEFWTNLSNTLVSAGCTVGGKVIAYWNGDNIFFSDTVIEAVKNAFVEADAFVETSTSYDAEVGMGINAGNMWTMTARQFLNKFAAYDAIEDHGIGEAHEFFANQNFILPGDVGVIGVFHPSNATYLSWTHVDLNSLQTKIISAASDKRYTLASPYEFLPGGMYVYDNDGTTKSTLFSANNGTANSWNFIDVTHFPATLDDIGNYVGSIKFGSNKIPLQDDAQYPDENPFPLKYPDWLPWEYPITVPHSEDLPTVRPTKYPGIGDDPEPSQDPAQNPDPEPVPEVYPKITPDMPLPNPNPTPVPTPVPSPDPDPQPEPDPIEPEPEPNPTPDPVDPNPDPIPTPIIPIPPLPSTVSSNKLFTVYNPGPSQLDSLGGYLWDSSIIAAIRDIWQDPLDGIISLIQVYATPPTGSDKHIILGFLDTGISCPVVSSQFVTIDCGSVQILERKQNVTDYSPYVSINLYLPFIGIVELDTNECMNATMNIKYKVDVYTGTCLAEVKITRAKDMPNGSILYTYSGNCSQQLPLTSGNATGVLTALVGGVTAGLSVASGGGLGVVAGAKIAGDSLTHEMFHVTHSGNISANAGIMGQKKPYVIISRRQSYDANNYCSFYGYPSNKTVSLGNYAGFVKVKSCWIKTKATEDEYEEIMELLSNGVFL